MTTPHTRHRPLRRGLDLAGAALLALLMLFVSVAGFGRVPALGSALNTGTGVWRLAGDADRAHPEDISLPGMVKPATIAFEDNGLAHITAEDDGDLFRSIGYLHARYRLTQMDVTRRLAAGELSEILGEATLESDQFQVDLGLRRAAERDWARLGPDDPARATLQAYADGVNAAIRQLTETDRLPTFFTMLGYAPRPWSPVDSLMVERVVGQRISFDDQAMVFHYAERTMPREAFDEWFPPFPENKQYPFDVGPFKKLPLDPLPIRAYPAEHVPVAHQRPMPAPGGDAAGADLAPLHEKIRKLPMSTLPKLGNSNAWAVSGSRTESGAAILAADPHLEYTIPTFFYQLEGRSPGYHFTGITTPGIPVPLMGKTDEYAWALVASMRPTVVYYQEKTDPARPDQYQWRGNWQRFTTVTSQIKVRGKGTVEHLTRLSVHGPMLNVQEMDVSVWWPGTLPSTNLASLLKMYKATNWQEFRESLRGWVSPALDFVYADRHGDIGAYNAGVAPQVPDGKNPALPLSGDGSADVVGTIPPAALPAAHNPPQGFVISANQREVAADYPYQYSTSYNFAVLGWRVDEIHLQLSKQDNVTVTSSTDLQLSFHENYARQLTPLLLEALEGEKLSPVEQRWADLLRKWDYRAAPDVPQPLLMEPFKNRYTWAVFQPWWTHYEIQQNKENSLLPTNPDTGSIGNETLRGTVLAWTMNDPDNRFFSLPDGTQRNAKMVLRQAFHETVAAVVDKHGDDVEHLRFDQQESLRFPSLLGVTALDVGPFPWGGTPRTINSSVGTRFDENGQPIGNVSTAGAVWRFVVDWGTREAIAVYPGGQSENPLSPWYDNGIPPWMKGEYWPVLEGTAAQRAATVQWKVTP